MAEFITILQEIKQLPPQVHLLCPRQDDNDQDRYEEDQGSLDDEVRTEGSRLDKIKGAESRRKKFISSLQLLAYDGQESEQYQRYIWERLDDALGKCDICIREYYIAKLGLLADLREEYDEDDIKSFFGIIDRRDVQRISDGLAGATKRLRDTPEHKRGTSVLEPVQLHAIFEALVCEAFLRNDSLLESHFDEPFRLIQSKKPLRIREYLPAVTRFLFDNSQRRLEWATSTWTRIDRAPTDLEWNWAMKDVLQQQLQGATSPSAIVRLWAALKVIVLKLDRNQITHNFFDLIPNVCTTALNHFSKQTFGVPFILQTMKVILEKAPEAFWQSVGSISSSTIIEQAFASPNFNKILQDTTTGHEGENQDLELLSWIPPFLGSLKPANRPPACHTLVLQLFERVHTDRLSVGARQVCFEMAVKVLLQTIISFSDDTNTRQSVERLVLSDTLNTISHRIDEILDPPVWQLPSPKKNQIRSDVLAVVRNSLALECQCLKADFETLSRDGVLHHESSSYSPDIWKAVVRNLHEDDIELSSAAVLGIMALPGLEQFWARDLDQSGKDKQSYNLIFDKLTAMVGSILERLSEFKPEHLDELFKAQDTSMSLIAALFSADSNTYQAAVDLVKNISGQSGRKEALGHLLEAFLSTTIYSICWTFRRISNMRTFASVPRMLRTGMEILDILCNSQTGLLRNKRLEGRDIPAIQSYWSYQWIALKTTFQQTEQWSREVHDKPLMTEVCRDAMQYAERLFEQYDLFASALITAKPERAAEIPKMLMNSSDTSSGSPIKTLDAMARWLRLRDEYLADTLVNLITKMLYRLDNHEDLASNEGLAYVEEVATKDHIKTMLSDQQKALLVRALERYRKMPIDRPQPKKQSTLKEWAESRILDGASTPTSVSRSQSVDEFGDSDIADNDLYELSGKSFTIHKASVAAKSQGSRPVEPTKLEPMKGKSAPVKPLISLQKKALDSRAFIENRKRELEARKLRDKEAAAILRGKQGIGEQTKGQGSGLLGIGVKGKDHSSGQSSMMVSSESEPSSGDESDEDLFGSKVRTAPPEGGATQIMGPAGRKPPPAGPIRKVKQQRSQKDMRARLAPDLSTLHRTILSWDFFVDSDLPPDSVRNDYTLVTNVFKNAADYQKTFEPLLVLEGWQSFRSAREDGTFKPFEVKIANSLVVNNFVEVNSQMSMTESKELGISVADIILLSKGKRPESEPTQPHCFARIKDISRKKGQVQIVFSINAANNSLRPFLSDKTTVWGTQVLSLTPLEREYGALMALPYYDLCEEIIKAKPSPLLEYSEKDLNDIVRIYDVNNAQAKAVKSALDNDAFTLIQGPPGSGKTKTICALVGAMMTGFLKPQNPDVGRRQSAAVPRRHLQAPPASKRVLVCAPSNAAVDELVMRFKSGVKMMDGSTEQLSIVRLGRSEAINASVKDVTLEELVNTRLNLVAPKNNKEDIFEVMMEHKETSEEIKTVLNKINDIRMKGELVQAEDESLYDGLKRKQKQLSERIENIRERQNTAVRDAELSRKRMQQEILDSAHVLCATLSGSGHEIFQGLNVEFETVIIDEAAQSIELSALIPLKYGCSKCILVGDPKQLPPTVLSREAARFQYEQSLFARMEKNHSKDVHLLDTQYRMHPEISLFPSQTFYDSRLKDGPGMAQLRSRPWHHSKILSPYRFFDVQGMSSAAPKGHSLVNIAELNVAMKLYDRLVTDVRGYEFAGKIGVITPYKGQLKEMKSKFSQRYGQDILSRIEFNTTDAFQGRESEIIIFSCVRASTKGIGFLNDIRRMNVGLTRAKCSLWVLGNSESLVQGEFWRGLVNDAKKRSLYTDGDVLGLLQRPLLTIDMMKDDVEMKDASAASAPAPAPAPSSRTPASLGPSPVENAASPTKDEKPPIPSQKNTVALSSRSSSVMSRQSSSSSSIVIIGSSSVNGLPSTSKLKATENETDVSKPGPGRRQDSITSTKSGRSDPSGGRFGLNDNAVCAICGSDSHFSNACDNDAALAASMGVCVRCKLPGHFQNTCQAARCIECGEVGHLSSNCKVPPQHRLTLAEKARVQSQEVEFGRLKDRARERRAEKQLGDHALKIPTVRSTLPPSTGGNTDSKRKRDASSPKDAPKGPKAMRMSSGGSENKHGRDVEGGEGPPSGGQERRPVEDRAAKNGGLPRPPMIPNVNVNVGGGRRATAAPVIKKKKVRDDDLFMKKK